MSKSECPEKGCNGTLEEFEIGIYSCNICYEEFVKTSGKLVNTEDITVKGMS